MRDRDNGRSDRPEQINPIMARIVNSAKELIDQFNKGLITQEQLDNQLRRTITPIYRTVLTKEQEAVKEWDKKVGVESLTTDTHGRRPLSWFTKTGLAFATGTTTTCVACVVLHPNVGMGAAHRNLITVDDLIRFTLQNMNSPISFIIEALPESSLDLAIVSPDSLTGSVKRTVNEAMSEFALLSFLGIPQAETTIALIGGNFLNQQQQKLLADTSLEAIRKHPAMNDGRARTGKRNVSFCSFLGQEGGIIW